MKKRTCALFLFNGYADWEPALALVGLNQYSDFAIHAFSFTGESVVSSGGLEVKVQKSIREIDPAAFDLLLLPGGEAWEKGENGDIFPLIRKTTGMGKTVAAICAATTILGKNGLLDKIPHTSNGLHYLKKLAPDYKGEALYQTVPAVRAGNIITANGAGMIEFAAEIFKAFNILDEEQTKGWLALYKSGGMDDSFYR